MSLELTSYLLGKKAGGGGTINNQNKTITENGSYTADAGYTGLGVVTVDVETPAPNLQNKNVTITENTTTNISADSGYDGLGQVSVTTDVPTGGDVSEYFEDTISAGNSGLPGFVSTIKKLPAYNFNSTSLEYAFQGYKGDEINTSNFDTTNTTNFHATFNNCTNLLNLPTLNTSSGTNFNSMYGSCSKVTSIPLTDTSKGLDFRYFASYCDHITTIPLINTSSGTMFSNFASSCTRLTQFPQIDTSNGTTASYMFYTSRALTDVPELNFEKMIDINGLFSNCNALTNLGGFLNLGQAYDTTRSANYGNYVLNLSYASNLTHDSLMNVINKLYDIATKGCNAQKLVLGSTNLAKLTAEEIAVATNKGWSVS